MGSFDGAEVCDLNDKYGKKQRRTLQRRRVWYSKKKPSGPQSEQTRKGITREFKKQGLNISISADLKICNFLDVTVNLTDGTYYPYRKPNNETLCIDTNSNHPPTIINIYQHPSDDGFLTFPQTKNTLTKLNHTTKVHLNKADMTKN